MDELTWVDKLWERCGKGPYNAIGKAWAEGYVCALADAGLIDASQLRRFLRHVETNRKDYDGFGQA